MFPNATRVKFTNDGCSTFSPQGYAYSYFTEKFPKANFDTSFPNSKVQEVMVTGNQSFVAGHRSTWLQLGFNRVISDNSTNVEQTQYRAHAPDICRRNFTGQPGDLPAAPCEDPDDVWVYCSCGPDIDSTQCGGSGFRAPKLGIEQCTSIFGGQYWQRVPFENDFGCALKPNVEPAPIAVGNQAIPGPGRPAPNLENRLLWGLCWWR